MLIDARAERPEPPRSDPRNGRSNVNWRKVGGLTTAGGLVMGSGAVSGPVGYGMLLAGVVAAGLSIGRGEHVSWSGLRDHRQ
jgi:hypothetical protein